MKYQLHLNWKLFLQQYWQKKPVLLKQAFKKFKDPLSAEELAGLAMEEEINSKIVSFKNGYWQVEQGPFHHFNQLSEENCALLVYSVNHWNKHAQQLVEPFLCLPQWQFDDLMVSYSTPGGSVGPHIDQYGVFIIQGSGKRHWRVGDRSEEYKQFCPTPDLLHVESFIPIIDDDLIAGDVLYIPPGCPHDGYSIETSLSFSVGFRTPNGQDLLSGLLEYVVTHEIGIQHYADPDLTLPQQSHQISTTEIDGLRKTLLNIINTPHYSQFLGEYLTRSAHALDIAEMQPPLHENELLQAISEGKVLTKVQGLKILMIEDCCFINGENMPFSADAGKLLATSQILDKAVLHKLLDEPEFVDQFTELVNLGYWYFIE